MEVPECYLSSLSLSPPNTLDNRLRLILWGFVQNLMLWARLITGTSARIQVTLCTAALLICKIACVILFC